MTGSEGQASLLAPPEEFFESVYRWNRDQIRDLQERRFLEVVEAAWQMPLYEGVWTESGLGREDITSLDDLQKLPTVDVDTFRISIEDNPPLGSHTRLSFGVSEDAPLRVFTSGGTTGHPRPMVYDDIEWNAYITTVARCLHHAGVRPGDVVQIPMTFGMHIGGFALYHALVDILGSTPVTTSSGLVTPTARQLELLDEFGVNTLVGFPDYMVYLAEELKKQGKDPLSSLPNLKSFVVAGEPSTVIRAWGRPAYDFFGASEYGMIGSQAPGEPGLRFWDDAAIVELLDPLDREPITEPDKPGSLVVTSLYRTASPIVRFDTRDVLSQAVEGAPGSPCALTHLGHHEGRTDGMIRIRGVNIWPEAIGRVLQDLAGFNGQYFCVIDSTGSPKRDSMQLMVEAAEATYEEQQLEEVLNKALRDTFDVRLDVTVSQPGSLSELTRYGIDNKIRRFEDRRSR